MKEKRVSWHDLIKLIKMYIVIKNTNKYEDRFRIGSKTLRY